jgi:hypothetical protein
VTVTTSSLTRAAGISAAVAGAIFIAVQIKHPPMTVATVATTEWVIRSSAKMVMAALALAGITGIYLRQVRQSGRLGLAGYVVFSIGYLLMFATEAIGTFVLPSLTSRNPQFVNDVVVKAFGDTPSGSIGSMSTFFALSGLFYMAGGVLFGIAMFRARVLARWAAALLAVSTGALAALAVLPDSFNRPMAVPIGVALIGLGVSLWSDQRTATTAVSEISEVSDPSSATESSTVR